MCMPNNKKPEAATLTSSVGDASSSSAAILANNAYNNSTRPTKDETKHIKAVTSTHSDHVRNTKYDLLWFLGPALICYALNTSIVPIYAIGIARIISTRLTLTLHYLFFDKDNYLNKLPQKQLQREGEDYVVGTILHMYAQIPLQVLFPGMFFSDPSVIAISAKRALIAHVLLVEPLYYAAHRWLHLPENMKSMHGFHHLSISTLPSTSLVQNFHEHFVYIAVFGPAFFAPFLLYGEMHWTIIGAYLVLFDLINAYGHMNIKYRHPIFTSKYSPFQYLFYTPEFHLGHHAFFRANYALFMPIWDHMFGSWRKYTKTDTDKLLPANKQDFVFIGHNAGLAHFLTCPEWDVYAAYGPFRTFKYLPYSVEFLFCNLVGAFCRLIMSCYTCSRYMINETLIGRVICICRTPIDYIKPSRYPLVNKDIVKLIKSQNKHYGTKCFGLGNLNKMKQVNDGGQLISDMVKADPELKDKDIRVWTGDTMTAASVYHQLSELPGFDTLDSIFFVGANGKIGNAVCKHLLTTKPNLKIRIYSLSHTLDHPNVTYTSDLADLLNHRVVVLGKQLGVRKYSKALSPFRGASSKKQELTPYKCRVILDYTVPYIPIDLTGFHNIEHHQIAVLETSPDSNFLKGHFDIGFGLEQHQIYPCHAGCIINTLYDRKTDEVGEICVKDMITMWKRGQELGLRNRPLKF
ncbi:fatty acid hydroxylase superfamily protein [Skeletonema marinoi]|uniref:Fatty acid hydroxylase superfamily protein n=1 Tax=Skeletonema marinoi TaxID=267567 RepID=A0A6V0ZX82_9STRA|nr:fatty acid hydroxylase superfamily protein [Skeletonema marinoi]|mmetsp:Transcript_26969/g.45881  ORF Transcript_26969/g.45881 Transcript_26969/m.45881 type:complete len:689 (-) Transcript_26969:125-2191(-)|eukprot:scaffold16518_cov139-Skeletonema_marinoi.AAC.14